VRYIISMPAARPGDS